MENVEGDITNFVNLCRRDFGSLSVYEVQNPEAEKLQIWL